MFKSVNKRVILEAIFIIIISGLCSLPGNCQPGGKELMNNKEEISSLKIEDLSIIVVYDNNLHKEELETAWGFSCVIKGLKETILFDTGGDGKILQKNMENLKISPEEIDIIVLSHIHGDHVGGLISFLEYNRDVVVYSLHSFPESFKDDVKNYGVKVVDVKETQEITGNVYSTGELGISIKEQSLILKTDKGLIVITGCAHPGIIEIVTKAKDLLNEDVLFVMGGFHLGGESERKIEKIVSDFRKLGVWYAGPCHCSGDVARELFEKEYKQNFINIGVGKVITIENIKGFCK